MFFLAIPVKIFKFSSNCTASLFLDIKMYKGKNNLNHAYSLKNFSYLISYLFNKQ